MEADWARDRTAEAIARYLDTRDRYLALKMRMGAPIALIQDVERMAREKERIDTAYAIAVEIVERLRRTAVREEDLPRRFWKKCLACLDTGVESFKVPQGQPGARPCIHCEAGARILMNWKQSWEDTYLDAHNKERTFTNGGPYAERELGPGTPSYTRIAATSDEEIKAILSEPCDHDLLPGPS